MLVRKAMFGWMIPAAFVLPLWLVAGWVISGASAWALLWVLLAAPGVFLWQLLITVLLRARGTVRLHRAMSWWDVLAIGLWHAMIVAAGFFAASWWLTVMISAIVLGIGVFWLELWLLWQEGQPLRAVLRTRSGASYIPPERPQAQTGNASHPVIVVEEKSGSPKR